jgi:transposase
MLTLGVDSHKHTYVAAAIDVTGRSLAKLTVPVTAAGRARLAQWAHALTPEAEARQWGIEGSGSYGRPLAQALALAGETVFEVPGIATARERHRSLGSQRQKSDATDALAVARVALRDADRLPRVRPSGEAYRCKLLTEHRDNLVLQRTGAINQLHVHVAALETIAPAALSAGRSRQTIRLWATRPFETTDPILAVHATILHQLAHFIQELDRAITVMTRQLVVLTASLAPRLLALRGVRALTAAKILGEAGEMARFPTAAHFASYAGVAPIEASSGDRRRHRLSRRGNRQLNRAIHMIAVTQRRWHPEARAYVARKITAGKTKKEALRGLKRHLANVIFRLLRADTPARHRTHPALSASGA